MPAEATGTRLLPAHRAAASCDLAELRVQTNTTRGAARTAVAASMVKVAGTNFT